MQADLDLPDNFPIITSKDAVKTQQLFHVLASQININLQTAGTTTIWVLSVETKLVDTIIHVLEQQ